MANTRVQAPTLQQFSALYVEKALLGQMFSERGIPEALGFLEPTDFCDSLNRAIYAALCALQAQGERADFARILDQMRQDGTRNDLELAGGLLYFYECIDMYLALGGGQVYARRILELAGKRRVGE